MLDSVSALRGAHRSTATLLSGLALAPACGEPPLPPPTAVIVAEPAHVCSGEAFTVDHLLHARFSAPRLNLAPVPANPDSGVLDYRWRLRGDEYRIARGGLEEAELVVQLAGGRPLHVELEVTNDVGGVALTPITLPLVIGAPDVCDSDDDCAAGPCGVCDTGVGRCTSSGAVP